MRQLTHLATIVASLVFSTPIIADTLHVDDDACPSIGTGAPADPYCAIQTAIDAALPGDEILVAPGTYAEIIDFDGKAVALRSTAGPDVTTIDATTVADPGTGKPVVRCDSGEGPNTLLEGFTLTGGTGSPNEKTSLFDGGGMYVHSSSPTVTDCIFIDNSVTGYGGGMHILGASPLVADCVFAQNSAVFGGGMFNENGGNTTVERCRFEDNTGRYGGGMFNRQSNPTMTDSTFVRNTADFSAGGGTGGGMRNSDASEPTVENCTFIENTAFHGGGMYNYNHAAPSVTNCTFMRNNGFNVGGGMSNSVSDATVTNCIFIGNTTTYADGGGMHNSIGDPSITNCTFYANYAERDGGGMFSIDNVSNDATPTVTNCILWNNADAGGMDESAQIHTDSGTPIVNYSNVQGAWTGAGGVGNLNADPLYVDADGPDNTPGTADDDLRLSLGSPCIDAADNTAVPVGITTDLTGNPRFVDNLISPDTGNGTPPIVDMGAHEAPASVCADVDADGDVDGSDFAFFAACFNKAGNPPRGGCSPEQAQAFDMDHDNDIDGLDFAVFAQCFNGAGNLPRTTGCPQN